MGYANLRYLGAFQGNIFELFEFGHFLEAGVDDIGAIQAKAFELRKFGHLHEICVADGVVN